MTAGSGSLRIGEFSRRVGVSAELLRAWERRYGLLRPDRSAGGFRLYTQEDAHRVELMRSGLARGLSAAQAAQAAQTDSAQRGPELAVGRSSGPADDFIEETVARLLDAIADYDEAGVQAVLDQAFEGLALVTAIDGVIMPALIELGRGWKRDSLAISREHFASNLIRARLLSLGRLWGRGNGPLALLACPQGERHDISLIAFGLVLRSRGWRIVFLGAETPFETIERTAETTDPDLTVLSSFDASVIERQKAALRRLAKRGRVALAGPAATDELCARLSVRRLDGAVAAAAAELAEPSASS